MRRPRCIGKVAEVKSRSFSNTITSKKFPAGHLSIVGSNSPAGLASRPIRVILADEIDKYPVSAGREGNPLALAEKRSITFWNRRVLLGSSPTVKGRSEVETRFMESDQRRYFVPCPDCGHEQTFRWENVKWSKDGAKHLPETACMMCEDCGTLWDDAQRHAAVRKGRWIAQAEFTGIAGFHIPAFISPWVQLGDVVKEFLEKRHDPERFKTFVNTVLGETWEEAAQKLDDADFLTRREPYGPQSLPEGVLLLTAGVDVHQDRLDVAVVGGRA